MQSADIDERDGHQGNLCLRLWPCKRPGAKEARSPAAGTTGWCPYRDHWVVPVEDENLETCISPASAGPLFALGLMSTFEFWRCPWKITARADHVGGALLTARATGHCHLPRLKISTV